LQSKAQVAHELEMTKQKIDDERHADLGHHGFFRVADEGLDLRVLFKEAEKALSGKGLARCLAIFPVRFQPLPLGMRFSLKQPAQ
jgi:hypothetical protein